MGIFALTILTYPISLLISFGTARSIAKDAAREGYKINIDYFKENRKDSKGIDKYYMYIPYLNVLKSLEIGLNYQFNKQEEFEAMRIYGAFIPMTKEEEDYYNEKKTFLRLMNIASKNYDKEYKEIRPKQSVKYSDNIKDDISLLNKEIKEHDIIIVENDKSKVVEIDELISKLNKEELETLRANLNMFKDWDKIFGDENLEDEYVIHKDKDKTLKLKFKGKN